MIDKHAPGLCGHQPVPWLMLAALHCIAQTPFMHVLRVFSIVAMVIVNTDGDKCRADSRKMYKKCLIIDALAPNTS